MHTGVCQIGISKHFLIYAIWKFSVPKRSARIIVSRQFRNFNADSFTYELSLATWDVIQHEP